MENEYRYADSSPPVQRYPDSASFSGISFEVAFEIAQGKPHNGVNNSDDVIDETKKSLTSSEPNS